MITTPSELTIEQRKTQVANLVLEGYSLRMIAKKLDIPNSTIQNDYHAILKELYAQRQVLGEAYLEEHIRLLDRKLDRLDELTERMFIEDPKQHIAYDDRAFNTLARYIEIKARLLAMPGYTGNAPQQTTAMQINISYNGNGASAVPQYEVSRDSIPGKAKRIAASDE